MGQYLAIGLPYRIVAFLETSSRYDVSLEDVCNEMRRVHYYDMNLFAGEVSDHSRFVFTLKDEPLKDGLVPFLEDFYPKIYPATCRTEEREYPQAIETLRNMPFEQWLDFARAKENYAFQMDDAAAISYLEIQKDFRPTVELRFECLLFYLGYGKVITEGLGDFERFFKHCFHEAFAQHPLAKAIKIYRTG